MDINSNYRLKNSKTVTRLSSPYHSTTISPVVVPIKEVKPLPQPISVTLGEKIIHKAFGVGVIYKNEDKRIRIRFDSVGEKTFQNPDAFEKGFLKKQ